MMNLLDNVHLVYPQLSILLASCLVLLFSVFVKRDHVSLWIITFVGLFVSALLSLSQLNVGPVAYLGDQVICDGLSQLMNFGIALTVIFCLFYSKEYMKQHQMPISDILSLSLFSTFGMMVLVCANTLLTSYLGLELISLPLYALTAVRRTSGDSSEAAMKYFVMGAIASGMLLYGFSLLYGITGVFELSKISSVLSAHAKEAPLLLTVSLIFILAGVGFKLALAPFHMWAPDVYQGAPLSVALFLSTAPKIAALVLAIRMLTVTFSAVAIEWQSILVGMTLLSIMVGNLFAIVQTNIRRLLAYSAVSHMGFTLFGLLGLNAMGNTSAIYYVLTYVMMTVAAFGMLVLLSHSGEEIEYIDDLKGLNQKNPWAAALFMLVMFSMAGVPPTAGFFIKLAVLKAVIDAHMITVAVISVLFAVIGAFYYLRIVKMMYFDNPQTVHSMTLNGGTFTKALFSVNCLSLLYFGIFPSGLISLCSNAFVS